MPTSITPVESQAYELLRELPQTENVKVKPKTKTTIKMAEQALIELHNVKGTTLKQIYSYILDKFDLEIISKMRITLIKKYLKSLWESDDIANITGRGLSGRFKLVDKKKFLKKILNNQKKMMSFNATDKSKITKSNSITNKSQRNDQVVLKSKKSKGFKNKAVPSLQDNPPVIPRQITPLSLYRNNTSIFDTPMIPSQVEASTPFINTLITHAPAVRKGAHKKKVPQDDIGTPRSSLPGKRRKLHNRREK